MGRREEKIIDEQIHSSMKEEALIFGKYLLSGETPDDKSVELYVKAHQFRDLSVQPSEEKLFAFVMLNTWSLGLIDSALAFSGPNHILRKKLLVMSAVLECRPNYASLFLPKKRSWFYFIAFLWIGFRGVCKAVFGKLLMLVAA